MQIKSKVTETETETQILAACQSGPIFASRLLESVRASDFAKRLALQRLQEAGGIVEFWTGNQTRQTQFYSLPGNVGQPDDLLAVIGSAKVLKSIDAPLTSFEQQAAKSEPERLERAAKQAAAMEALNRKREMQFRDKESKVLDDLDSAWSKAEDNQRYADQQHNERHSKSPSHLSKQRAALAARKRNFYRLEYQKRLGLEIPDGLLDEIAPAPAAEQLPTV